MVYFSKRELALKFLSFFSTTLAPSQAFITCLFVPPCCLLLLSSLPPFLPFMGSFIPSPKTPQRETFLSLVYSNSHYRVFAGLMRLPGLGITLDTMARIFVRGERELVLKSDTGKERSTERWGEAGFMSPQTQACWDHQKLGEAKIAL